MVSGEHLKAISVPLSRVSLSVFDPNLSAVIQLIHSGYSPCRLVSPTASEHWSLSLYAVGHFPHLSSFSQPASQSSLRYASLN